MKELSASVAVGALIAAPTAFLMTYNLAAGVFAVLYLSSLVLLGSMLQQISDEIKKGK